MRLARPAALAAALSMIGGPAVAKKMPPPPPPEDDGDAYHEVVASVAEMIDDDRAQRLAAKHGLGLVDVTWEDTGRWEDSALGPNISDVTIEVEADSANHERYLMPVLRFDNFTDKTGDVKLDRIFLPVGNEDGDATLETITLKDLLDDPDRYMSLPKDGKIVGGSLLAERDSHALVSAQHAFLPVPADGKATFWPVIFNYQSYPDNPAVLTLLVTRQGTSMTVIDNQRDVTGTSWGQRLYFNHDGKKAPLIAERLKDVKAKGKTRNGEDAGSLGEDANLLMIIQVPLKQAEPVRQEIAAGEADAFDEEAPPPAPAEKKQKSAGRGRDRSDVDVAVIGHGEDEGPYTELAGLTIERDPRFPVRVTVQFYQATSNGVVDRDDLARMAKQIDKVYDKADYVGSLVVPDPNGKRRPTRWDGASPAPDALGWWHFPGLAHRYRMWGWRWVAEPVEPEEHAGIW
jgi:hypothetical protein